MKIKESLEFAKWIVLQIFSLKPKISGDQVYKSAANSFSEITRTGKIANVKAVM